MLAKYLCSQHQLIHRSSAIEQVFYVHLSFAGLPPLPIHFTVVAVLHVFSLHLWHEYWDFWICNILYVLLQCWACFIQLLQIVSGKSTNAIMWFPHFLFWHELDSGLVAESVTVNSTVRHLHCIWSYCCLIFLSQWWQLLHNIVSM